MQVNQAFTEDAVHYTRQSMGAKEATFCFSAHLLYKGVMQMVISIMSGPHNGPTVISGFNVHVKWSVTERRNFVLPNVCKIK